MPDITKIKVADESESSYQLYPRNEEFAKRSGNGGSGVQHDWNQNDATKPDYIKNRPFYAGDPVEMVLLEETAITIADMQNLVSSSFPYSFEVGQTYVITFDGVNTEYTAYRQNDRVVVGGDYSSVFGGSGYFLGVLNGDLFLITKDESLNGSHTIAIKEYAREIVKIDEKYIPEGLPYLSKENPTCTGSFSINRRYGTTVGPYSFTEGFDTTASGAKSHAEGLYTTASGTNSHAEGQSTTASGANSHAEGFDTTASGNDSHAEGATTTASGNDSHAEGYHTKASSNYQHVQGKFNIEDSSNTYAHIVGNGTSGTSRSNAHTLDWSGNAWYAGDVEGKALILPSSTEGSTKKFKITVDDSGTLTATEVS